MTGSDSHAWTRAIAPALLVAIVAGVFSVVVSNIIDSLRVAGERDVALSARVTLLESEHLEHRLHMRGSGIAPGNDHPGRTVENPTARHGRGR